MDMFGAMIRSSTIDIPQKLRWMTEWSESYCKQLEKNYWLLKGFCQVCKKHKEKVKNKDAEKAACTFCSKSCEVYKDHVEKWKTQWEEQEKEYNKLYKPNGASSGDPIKEQEKDFMKTVKDTNGIPHCTGKNSDNTNYDTLGNYVSSMGGSTYCNDTTQQKFDNTNSSDEKSVFKEHPNKYDKECEEDTKQTQPKPPPGAPGFLPPASTTPAAQICEKVKDCIKANEEKRKSQNGDCNEKKGDFDWKCEESEFKSGENGACMPHRRQKLCIHYLKELTNGSESELKEAFIKCAALETYFAWKKYKEDKKKEKSPTATNLDEQLKNGNIPSDFLRSIFFSYADYRDLCLNKDIGKKNPNEDVKMAADNITKVFNNNGGESEDKRKNWWNENGLDILQGMICALSNTVGDSEKDEVQQKLLKNPEYKYDPNNLDNKIASYVLYTHTTPQFLRWFTEWSEEFCDKQKKEFAELFKKCKKCNVKTGNPKTCEKKDDCTECKAQCQEYTDFINKWKSDWDQQNQHYNKVKNEDPYDSAPFVDTNSHAYTYLNESLELLGLHDNCMKTPSTTATQKSGAATGGDMPQALDDPPSGFKDKCKCEEDTKPSGAGQDSGTSPSGKPQDGSGHSVPNPPKPMPDPNPSHPGSSSGNTPPCDIANNILKTKGRDGQGRIAACGEKKYESKNWDCTNKSIDTTKHDGACMSPRRQSLCINNLKNLKVDKKLDDLRKALIECTSIETYWLWEKYKKDHPNEADKLTSGNIPEGFKRQMFYTVGDFKDLIFDTDISAKKDTSNEENDVGAATKYIKNIFDKSGQSGGQKIDPKDWWTNIEKEVWEGMLCALSYDGSKVDTTMRDNLKGKYPYGTVTFDSPTSGKATNLTTFASRPQFLRWMTEWYDDYCQQKHTKLQEVVGTCKPQGGKELKCDSDCETKCNDYTKFMEDKKKEWDKQKDYYGKQKPTNPTDYNGTDAKDYLQKNFTVTCGDKQQQSGTSNSVATNIEWLTKSSPQVSSQPQTPSSSSYYDADVYCGCKKFIGDDADYNTISGQNNCKGLKKEADETNTNSGKGIRWQNIDDDEYKNSKLSPNVYIPPRRQRICFKDLDNKTNVTNKQQLREQLMKDAATEGYNLGTYYKEKANNGSSDKYKYDVEACNALKYSFLDLRDIILGYDNLEPPENGTEKNLQKIFNNNGSSGGTSGSPKRKEFWNNNKDCVWNAMLCGYRKGRDDGHSGNTSKPSEKDLANCKDKMPNDSEYPLGKNRDEGKEYQFLRWFQEWSEDFCVKQKKELATLQNKCSGCKPTSGKCGNGCTDCHAQCQTYQDFIKLWKPQYEKQSKKFTTDKSTYKQDTVANQSTHAYEYLHAKIKDLTCSTSANSGKNCDCMEHKSQTTSSSGTHMPKSLDQIPESVKEKCECDNKVVPPVPQPGAPQNPDQQNKNPSSQGGTSTGPNGGPDGGSGGPGGQTPEPKPGTTPSGGPSVPGNSDPNQVPSGGSHTPGQSSNTNHSSDPTNQGTRGHSNPTPKPGPVSPSSEPKKNTDEFAHLDDCPLNDNNACTKIGNAGCPPKKQNYDLDKWETQHSTHSNFKNKKVLVPPRRKNICFNYIIKRWHTLGKEELFTKRLLDTASSEAELLSKKYKEYKEREVLFDSMKYSFADIGNIIKGDDILEDLRTKRVHKIFEKICKNGSKCKNGNTDIEKIKNKRKNWWTNNKTKVWHAMLCGYKRIATNGTLDNKWCTVPTEDETPQFLRWFQEWTEIFCTRKKELENEVKSKCDNFNCDNGTGNVDDTCKTVCERYKNFILSKQIMYKLLEKQYNDNYIKNNAGGREAPDYLKIKCKDGKCDCITKNFNNDENWKEPYETFDHTKYKSICECKKPPSSSSTSNSTSKSSDIFSDLWKTIAGPVFNLAEKSVNWGIGATTATIDAATKIIPDAADLGLKAGIGALDKIKTMLDATNPKSTNPQPPPPPPPVAPDAGTGGKQTPQSPITPPSSGGIDPNNLVTSTIPAVGIGVALGSIALLFYLK
ncbi:erythrocyte membrane protein 1 (PfEMP1), truncated, putative [Plasmodium sp. gorilla clade G2]|uniref:erythrocyte membrane protein 1 (PfEMP1), truncated, putative n=1 Tax=Plasmodium sp. gorilla clade G2 TaxID=880535 RepID=UPI000D2DB7A3|nr:erythrocyte membrane protein 1 (PfEMP1), truncated, putative [Plasmodium sp. gorilla clade G2]SOV20385.1 erythrocyte membrane protein 1 (PfEMP1), truncated, putative [Plasmodium sp. gorilla clade G2]